MIKRYANAVATSTTPGYESIHFVVKYGLSVSAPDIVVVIAFNIVIMIIVYKLSSSLSISIAAKHGRFLR